MIQYRFSLTHDTLGTIGIEEPIGADDFKIRLTREFRDIELIGLNALFADIDLAFYGIAKQFIEDCIDDGGNDTEVTITIDYSEDEGESWATLTPGLLDLEAKEERDDKERGLVFFIPITFSSFWQKFLQRIDTKVNIVTDTDLGGGTRESIPHHLIDMHSQTVRKEFRAILADDDEHSEIGVSLPVGDSTFYFVPPFADVVINDIDKISGAGGVYFDTIAPTKFLYEVQDNLATYNAATSVEHTLSNEGNDIFCLGGTFGIDISNPLDGIIINTVSVRMYYRINEDTPVQIGTTLSDSPGTDSYTDTHSFTDSDTLQLAAGDQLKVYFQLDINMAGNSTKNITFHFYNPDALGIGFLCGMKLRLYVDTKQFLQLDRQCFKAHEAAQKICNAITEQNGSFYSEFFGNSFTSGQTYTENGCGSFSALMKGKHMKGEVIAGISLSDFPFDISFKEWFTGYNAEHNLGAHEEEVGGVKRVRVEEKAYFFQTGSPVLTLQGVDELTKRLASDFYFTDVDIGYDSWKHSESYASLDDWATRHYYSTRFKNIGIKKSIKSNFISATYAIELTKREYNKDGGFDDNLFLIYLDREGYLDLETPEIDENFGATTNVLFPETAYNLRATPARMLLKWGTYLNIPFWEYSGEVYRFQGGEGNLDMESQVNGDCAGNYDNVNLHENQNIPWNYFYGTRAEQQPLFIPIWWEFKFPLSFTDFLLILDNKINSISVQDFDGTYKEVFPWDIEFNPRKPGETSFKCIEAYI